MPPAPDFAAALALHRAGDLAGAEQLYRSIIAGRDDRAAINNLAVILQTTGQADEARALYERNTRLAPADPGAHAVLAHLCRQMRDLEAAERAYRRVLELQPGDPTASFGLALTLLGMGRYGEGWTLYEARDARARMLAANLPFPEWRGEPLKGKRLMIRREQGYGDQIMMARFFGQLGAAETTYYGGAPMGRLVSQLGLGFTEIAPENRLAAHDYWTLPMSLPARLGLTLESIPAAPYLAGTARPAGGRVGFVGAGEATNPNQRFRAIPDGLAQELLSLSGVVSLAPEATGARDFQDTADLIAGLDLVVSVDTAVAHLAGALGKPTWVLTPAHGLDWHWLRTRSDSPWYPSVRVIRQATPGDWAPVIRDVAAELKQLGLAA